MDRRSIPGIAEEAAEAALQKKTGTFAPDLP
jgi:hypothetical protein